MLEKHIQVISRDLMNALKESASEHGISLDMEIAVRLTAYMAEPELARDNALSSRILRQTFTTDEAVAECKRNRNAAFYNYEVEKLRLFLRFEKSLPRNTTEKFLLIDVKALTPKIRAEIEAEERNQN